MNNTNKPSLYLEKYYFKTKTELELTNLNLFKNYTT